MKKLLLLSLVLLNSVEVLAIRSCTTQDFGDIWCKGKYINTVTTPGGAVYTDPGTKNWCRDVIGGDTIEIYNSDILQCSNNV